MVKSVVGEETQLKSAEDRLFQSSVSAEVGLVIGKLSSSLDRGFVFDLVPTPPNDAGDPACSVSDSGRDDRKKGSKGKSQAEASVLLVDGDWVAEHARQVSRMLLGGMNVVGLYIWASESSYKTSSTLLWQTVKGVAEAVPFYESDLDERLLIHISYSPRRWTCRNCTIGSSITSTGLRPCDFKMGKLLANVQTFRCIYNFEMRLPMFQKDASNARTLRDVLCAKISCLAKELKGAKALVDGDLVVNNEQCTSDGLHNVELLLPVGKDGPAEACSTEEVIGIVVLSGAICSSAYRCPREPISQAILDIKEDIITSLRSRLDIIYDDVGDVVSSSVDGGEEANKEVPTEKSTHQLFLCGLRKPCTLIFPRRVLIPWLADCYICDYLQSSETFEDLKCHCQEMMSMEISTDTAILELETEATTSTAKVFWDVIPGDLASQSESCIMKKEMESSGKEGITTSNFRNSNILIAIAVLLLSIFLALGWSLLVP
ncbi:hypothetical protein AAC387_Pa03g4077 [Persea americana]